MSDWINPVTNWTTNRPIQTADLNRAEGNSSHLRDGEVTFSGRKTFNGVCDFIGEVISRSALIARESALIQGVLTVQGNVSIAPRTGVGGTGNLTVDDTVTVNEMLVVNGTTDLNGTADISGNTTVGGTMGITSNTTVGGTMGITSNTTIGGTLASGALTVTGAASTTGDVTVGGHLDLSDMGSRSQTSGNLGVGNTVTVPAGMNFVTLSLSFPGSADIATIEVRDSDGTWQAVGFISTTSTFSSIWFPSDGTNARVSRFSGSGTVVYRFISTQ